MNRRQVERWALTRERGRRRFILLNGMCFFGLSWGFFMSLMLGLGLLGKSGGDRVAQAAAGFRWETFGQGLLIYVPAGMIAGALWGLIMWHIGEWQYRRQLNKDAAAAVPAAKKDGDA